VNDEGEKNNRLLCKVKKGGLNGAFILLFAPNHVHGHARNCSLFLRSVHSFAAKKPLSSSRQRVWRSLIQQALDFAK